MGLVSELRASARLGLAIAAAAVTVGIIYGYDTSNIGGALLFIAKEFDLTPFQKGQVTTAVVYGEILGALSGGALANRIGRKRSMVAVAATFALFSLASALAWSIPSLMVARFLLGLTIGVSIVVAPVFIAESAAPAIRGALLVLYQVATVTGIILGYLIAWALSGTESWRWMLGVAAIPGALVTVGLLRLPDTARWYVMRGRLAEARATLARIDPRNDPDVEVAEIQRALREETGGGGIGSQLAEMFRTPYLRATVFVVGLGFFVQITGINAIVYYNPQIFEAMGMRGNAALLGLPTLVQLASLIAVGVSVLIVDRMGRRPVLLGGIGIMVAADVLLVAVFATGLAKVSALVSAGLPVPAGAVSTASAVLGFVGILLFTVGFTFGFGALVWVYAGESFPARLRSLGASLMLTADLVANVIVGALFPVMLNRLGGAVTFGLLGLMTVVAFGFVLRLAPETKGRRLEDIQYYWKNGGRWPERV